MRYSVLVSASMLAVALLAAEQAIGSAQTIKDKIEDTVQSTGDKMQEKADRAGDKIKGTVDNALATTADKARAAGDTIGQKTVQAGDKAKGLAREAKSEISDSWLTAKTKIALFADERVKGRQISVETGKGTVMLRGKVDSEEAKAAAESIATGIDGVQGVKNELQVVAPTERAAVDASDKDIQKAVEDRLAADPQLKRTDARSDSRVVTLTGEVPGIGHSARASEIARGVPGVRSVKNDLTVKQGRRESMGGQAAPTGYQRHVELMQQALKENGIEPGPVDGIMGPQTVAALKAYQEREKLAVTGRPDAETLGRLGVGVGGADDTRTAPQRKQMP